MPSSTDATPAELHAASDASVPAPSAPDTDLAQAFKDLTKGEKTAQVLEAHLSSLERKLDDMLAKFEQEAQLMGHAVASDGGAEANGEKKDKE